MRSAARRCSPPEQESASWAYAVSKRRRRILIGHPAGAGILMSTQDTGTRDIVLIHGLWMTPKCWEGWAERYRGRGHAVHVPSWPGLDGEPEGLRRDPSRMPDLSVEQIRFAFLYLATLERLTPAGTTWSVPPAMKRSGARSAFP